MMKYALNLVIAGGVFVCMLAGGLCTTTGAADTPVVVNNKQRATSYVPDEIYEGRYLTTRLFYRSPDSPLWRRMVKFDDFRTIVTCKDALTAFETTGTWQGHLNPNGSCSAVTAEPAIFAIGNRINYERLLGK